MVVKLPMTITYDDPEFFKQYSQLGRSINGLDGNAEWEDFKSLIPGLRGKRLLDLGCGFGDICRYASEQGAETVVGVDISKRMLEEATRRTSQPNITYVHGSMAELDFTGSSFEVIASSLALHYVERFDLLSKKIAELLTPGGTFIASFEHPIYTSTAAQDWFVQDGERLHWPVDDYSLEGPRRTSFLGGDVLKYHRTVSSYVTCLLDAGLRIERLIEPVPNDAMLEAHPDWKDEVRRPIFMLISATKPEI
jgi:SAM-dependent methyltransferase